MCQSFFLFDLVNAPIDFLLFRIPFRNSYNDIFRLVYG